MKIELDTNNADDRKLLLRIFPHLAESARPAPDDRLGRGHDALARLVAFWRQIRATPEGMEKDDIGPALLGELTQHGDAIAVYVDACGGRLWRACAAVWSLDSRGTSQEQAAADESEARKCAGALVTIASALGLQLPIAWLGEEVSGGN